MSLAAQSIVNLSKVDVLVVTMNTRSSRSSSAATSNDTHSLVQMQNFTIENRQKLENGVENKLLTINNGLEVKTNKYGVRGLFATKDIQTDVYITVYESYHRFKKPLMPPSSIVIKTWLTNPYLTMLQTHYNTATDRESHHHKITSGAQYVYVGADIVKDKIGGGSFANQPNRSESPNTVFIYGSSGSDDDWPYLKSIRLIKSGEEILVSYGSAGNEAGTFGLQNFVIDWKKTDLKNNIVACKDHTWPFSDENNEIKRRLLYALDGLRYLEHVKPHLANTIKEEIFNLHIQNTTYPRVVLRLSNS